MSMLLAGPMLSSQMGSTIPTDGLLLHYTMDNISGSTLIDETGNYDGTISGAITTTGQVGNALYFDGIDDDVNCGPLAISTATSDITVAIWVDNIDAGDAVYFGKYSALPAFAEIGRSSSDDKFYFRIGNGPSSNLTLKDSSTIASYGSGLVLIIGEYESSAGTARIFVNNTQKNSASITRNSSRNTDNLYLGRRGFPGAFEYGSCIVDEVRVYNRILTTAEKTLLFNE